MQGHLPKDWLFTLKAATRDLVSACGGVARAAAEISVSTTTLSRWQSVEHPDLITLPAKLLLEAECGVPYLTRAEAGLLGLSLEQSSPKADDGSLIAAHGSVMASFATVSEVLALALGDMKITAGEADQYDRALSKMARDIENARRICAGAKATASNPLKVV